MNSYHDVSFHFNEKDTIYNGFVLFHRHPLLKDYRRVLFFYFIS